MYEKLRKPVTLSLAVSSLRGSHGVPYPPTIVCALHFGLLKILFLTSRNGKATDNETMMQKEIITFNPDVQT